MKTIKKVTSITTLTTAEGQRLTGTYSIIDETGNIISENNRFNRIVVDSATLNAISDIKAYAQVIADSIED